MKNTNNNNNQFYILTDQDQDNLIIDLWEYDSLGELATRVLDIVSSYMMKEIHQIVDDNSDMKKIIILMYKWRPLELII